MTREAYSFEASTSYHKVMAIPKELEDILVSSADTLSGAVRFQGTRVLVQSLLDALMTGGTVEDFLDSYPSVTREQAEAVVRWEQVQAREALGIQQAG